MMPIIMLLPFLLLSAAEAQQQEGASNVVKPGSSLTPKTNLSWPSPSGLYAFGFYEQGDGYAVGIFLAKLPQKTVVWTANRDSSTPLPADVKLEFTTDGRLVLQSAQGVKTPLDISSDGASSASMLDSGNFVLYGSANRILWQSFDNPTDTLLATQNLTKRQVLTSSLSKSNQTRGKFLLLMQEDGVLAMYPVGTPYTDVYGYWSSVGWSFVVKDTALGPVIDGILTLDGDGGLYLFNGDGRLYLFNSSGNHTLNPASGTLLYRLTIDPDGIMRLYSHDMTQTGNWTVAWSRPDDGCAPKGLCGLNGYCVSKNRVVDCECLPGFAPVKEGDWGSGCDRTFTAESCSASSKSKYTMTESNTEWKNDNYSLVTSLTKENCSDACLQDCKCEAAFFKDGVGECTKQRLPLRFGRSDTSGSTVAFIKIGTSTLPKPGKKEHILIIIGVSLGVFAFIVLAISGFGIYKNRVMLYQMMPKNGNIELGEDVAPKSFTYAQLENATHGFSKELGRGAFGTVYEGAISNGQIKEIVAVKRLDRSMLAERERQFHAEMKVIGRTHHKNLVRLLGYCHDGLNRLLVYKYMSNGSLADKLFTPEKQLSWDKRMEIACNIARGLIYLHEECEPQIIHCDIKPQNILIDEDGCAKISDFGLAKLLNAAQTKTFTEIRGTQGYIAPEWRQHLPVTDKVDVYSFGIVLLEIISCRKSMDSNLPEEEANLKEWANHCFNSGELGKLVNNEEVDKRELEKMVKIGLWCTSDELPLRPSMKKVLHMLEGIVNIPVSASPTSSLISC
ncbi:G-type lectin S-receptor-like serine/threonine-protein kinase LECRK1 [Corylus avellana]|uniref:G-type lectin S-receptor-like serine/threonine-protein kinase LECRK1 n=1 Tax=Corylus avellana TaxID=13451 RepID=UPI001E20F00A|nr:G-type lectin S-receptor-like serine/threonine-protein kinase LECRK1 [Corylus avellana]